MTERTIYDEVSHCFSCTGELPESPEGDGPLDSDGEPNLGVGVFVQDGPEPGFVVVCPSCARMTRGPMGTALFNFCAKDRRGFYSPTEGGEHE